MLFGTSQFSFIVGTIFAKEKVFSKTVHRLNNVSFKNTLCYGGIISLVILHSFYESAIIAPITGVSLIFMFVIMNKSIWVEKVLVYFANHSTNIWLTHMFFYETIFTSLTFAPRYPILIFVWLLILCIISSYIINAMYRPLIKLFESKVPLRQNQNQRNVG